MRLIDADELIKYIKIWEIGTSISSDQKEFIDCVNEQPTAFDAEKVTESLMDRFRVVSNDEDYHPPVHTDSHTLTNKRSYEQESLKKCILLLPQSSQK